jgi:glutamate racemase
VQTIDFLAGQNHRTGIMKTLQRRIMVFDSGLGGLTVFSEIVRLRPDAQFVYVADDAAFPYGAWPEDALVERIVALMAALVGEHRPDCVVLACNTASTLALPALRARFDLPFIGTVPAVKPAAQLSASRMITVLATPGTVSRDYTRSLIARFAGDCEVTLVGSRRLAAMAEAQLRGETVPDAEVLAEIAPCFVSRERPGGGESGYAGSDPLRRTDVVTLSCTHYPLLLDRFTRLAPWPVQWIDPAPAIARRVAEVLGSAPDGAPPGEARATFTAGEPPAALAAVLERFGIGAILPPARFPTR